MRLKQEIVLGIGGWRLLRELGLHPEVCHLNEGHAAFAVLERARCYMEDHRVPFEVALTITRAGNMFTTHTAVPAGFDRFDPELVSKYLAHYAKDELAIPWRAARLRKAESGRCVRAFQHGLPCASRQRSGKRRQQASRRGEQAHLSAAISRLAAGRGSHRLRDQRHSCAHLGFGGVGRTVDEGMRSGPLAKQIVRSGTTFGS